jgi:toxin-antitoxin system PIN domain toxin
VILLDANLLVYAYAPGSPHHHPALKWLEDVLSGPSKVGLPWPTLLAFVRLIGNPRVVQNPVPLSRSWACVRQWLALPQVWTPLPTDRHEQVISDLLVGESRVDLANDAHLAALAIEHGLTLCSADRDFARFAGLRWQNPLEGA